MDLEASKVRFSLPSSGSPLKLKVMERVDGEIVMSEDKVCKELEEWCGAQEVGGCRSE